jgi:hypothetical protein
MKAFFIAAVTAASAAAHSPSRGIESAGFDRTDSEPNPPLPTCVPRSLGLNMDAPAHDLLQTAAPQTSLACASACCKEPRCGGALFEPTSAVTYGGCTVGKPCCFMKTSVADAEPTHPPTSGGSELWQMVGRSQDDERLNFLSATLGSHMVLQRAPAAAIVWGHTAPGATVTTTMAPGNLTLCMSGSPWVPCAPQTFSATAGADGTWRQALPPIAASGVAYNFSFASSNSTGERAEMTDVLFGDVYLCGGQSNMEFALPANANTTAERQRANDYSTVRIFSVGHRTSSPTPLRDLQTIWEPWQVVSNSTIAKDFSPGHTLFSTFSAVCWFFGRTLSDALDVPIGLISNNWGGTALEVWTPPEAFPPCNRPAPAHGAPMYNAMIHP